MGAERTAFEIVLAWSDRSVTVSAGEAALDALLAAGLAIPVGCRVGTCGLCATDYVEGDVQHRDACLSASERTHQWCPCVSRAGSRIVVPL
jgi:ferredoxin